MPLVCPWRATCGGTMDSRSRQQRRCMIGLSHADRDLPTGELRVQLAFVVGRVGIDEPLSVGGLRRGLEQRAGKKGRCGRGFVGPGGARRGGGWGARCLGPRQPDVAAESRAGDLRAMGALARWIALAGLAMSLSHATTPLSGYEHVLSHVLDMLGEWQRRPLAVHGAQVAIASLRMASIYQAFVRDFDPRTVDWPACFPGAEGARMQVEAAFADIDPTGRTGAECWKDYAVKLEVWHAHRERARRSLEAWADLRPDLAQRVWPAAQVERIMVAAGLATDFPGLQPQVEAAHASRAFLTAHWIRKRFTLGDLLHFLRWDRQALWERASGRRGPSD